MTNKNRIDIIDSLNQIKKILFAQPDYQKMRDEIRMMGFKVKPLVGNVAEVNLQDLRLMEIIWRLGKLEEFFIRDFDKIPVKQQQSFLRIFEMVKKHLQDSLTRLDIRQNNPQNFSPWVEMEIIKEIPHQDKIN
jgi:hypothetical protein